MAVELFKPFIIHELEKRGEAETVKRAKKLVERDDPKVYEVLEEIIKDHPVLLNRAPTLHRLGIQAFEPVLVEGKAIRIHPLVCAAFNADFDGDQMAVHVPLSFEAQLEARVLMLASNNILLPSNGRPVASPSQDMVIGCYYLTKAPLAVQDAEDTLRAARNKERRDAAQKVLDEIYAKAPRYGRFAEAESALALRHVGFHTPCWFWVERRDPEAPEEQSQQEQQRGKWVRTTVGRAVFNSVCPEELGYWNVTMGKRELGEIIFQAYRNVGLKRTTEFLDALKDFGFRYATLGGISVGLVDLVVPTEKGEILGEAEEEVSRFTRAYQNGVISNGERYNKVRSEERRVGKEGTTRWAPVHQKPNGRVSCATGVVAAAQ